MVKPCYVTLSYEKLHIYLNTYRIIKSIERYAENVDLSKRTNMRMVTDNVVLEIWTLDKHSPPVIGLAAESHANLQTEVAFQHEKITTIFNTSQLYGVNVDAAIQLPEEVFGNSSNGKCDLHMYIHVYRTSFVLVTGSC